MRRKVLLGGAFNILHPGHVKLLKAAKKFGFLVIVIASDRTVLKSKGLLAAPAKDRAMMVKALGIANKVVIGHPKDFWKTVEKEKPRLVLLGYDQKLPKEMKKKLGEKGILVKRMKRFGNYSTGKLIRSAGKSMTAKVNKGK